jgi:hypothetical protein
MIQPVLAADPFASAKNAYIASHPGQSLIPYPWEPTSGVKVLPFNYTVPAVPGNNLFISACPDQFESTSFVITAQKQLTGIAITPSPLSDGLGHTIPASAIDVHLVKVWYQRDSFESTNNVILTPELLLKNDSLIRVNYNKQLNEIWVKNRTYEGYVPVAYTSKVFNYTIFDNATSSGGVQPFSVLQNENKQIWITTHIPAGMTAGNYTGTITLSSPTSAAVTMNFAVQVLPFTLEPTSLRYILYYKGRVADTWRPTNISAEWRTPQMYALELQNMKDHGISYPVLSQDDDEPSMLNTALTLRSQSGLPKDRIYLTWNAYIGNATDAAGLAKVADLVKSWKTYTSAYGFGTIYFHGMDEVRGNLVLSQRTAWTTVHTNGGRIVTTSFDTTDPVDLTGDILDAASIGTRVNLTAAYVMHKYGHEIYLYNQPQVGIENPEIYRKNYGFSLWNSGYDGEMDFAYQGQNGNSIWNDLDNPTKDEVFAYPTSSGVIDTIEWEGFREGVDDTRFAATLKKKEGNDINAKSIVSASLTAGNATPVIRQKIIDRIISSNTQSSTSSSTITPTPTPKTTSGKQSEVGVYKNGTWLLDYNGDYVGNTSTDKTYNFRPIAGTPVIGDWNGDGRTKAGIYNDGAWYLDYNGDGVYTTGTDTNFVFGSAGYTAVVGDWNGDGKTEAGTYRDGTFYLDYNGNGGWQGPSTDRTIQWVVSGYAPVVGDWNGDGKTEVGIYKDGTFYLDYNGDFKWSTSTDLPYWFGSAGGTSVIGDWNGDGRSKVGIYKDGTWYLDNNGDGVYTTGTDKNFVFGAAGYTPVIGDWNRDGKTEAGFYKDGTFYLDYNGNGGWQGPSTDRTIQWQGTGYTPLVGKWNGL